MNRFGTKLILAAALITLTSGSWARDQRLVWLEECETQIKRELGDDVRRVQLRDIKVSTIRVGVSTYSGKRFPALCRMDRETDQVIAYRHGEGDWQPVKLHVGT